MTTEELKMAADFLRRASEEFSNHGCNDFELPNTPENVTLLNRIEQWSVGPGRKPETVFKYDPSLPRLMTYDWGLMAYLADCLKHMSEGKAHGH